LRAYLQQRVAQDPGCERLFLNANGMALTRFGVRYILRKCVTQAQRVCLSLTRKQVSPHTLRHTTAMHLLRSGNEVNMVSYWLGHADINTTHIYVEIDMEMKRQMLEKAPSPAVRRARPWRQPGILDWLNRLGRAPGLCGANSAKPTPKARQQPQRDGLNFT
jgi:site-specific recombinase XerC